MEATLKKIEAAFLSGVLIWAMATIVAPGAAWAQAQGNRAEGFQAVGQAAGATQMAMAMSPGSANVLVLQEPTQPVAPTDGFISIDTVIIGCTAGAAAGALAIALPVLTVASGGIGLPASVSAILSTAGIGCAVGVVSGLAAIGTAWGLNVINRLGDSASD
jgi:hypothetical protein